MFSPEIDFAKKIPEHVISVRFFIISFYRIILIKIKCLDKGKVNPLIGAAGISAYPMSARVVQKEGQKYNPKNYLLMHAMGANTGGQVGSVLAAAVMLSILKGMGII